MASLPAHALLLGDRRSPTAARVYANEAERVAAYATFIHYDKHHRGHTALGGKSPADRVPNLRGQYT